MRRLLRFAITIGVTVLGVFSDPASVWADSPSPQFTVAVDLDRTLFHRLEGEEQRQAMRFFPERVIAASDGYHYVAYPGAADFLTSLSFQPDIELFIWSAGPEPRIRELIDTLKASRGQSVSPLIDGFLSMSDLSDDQFSLDPPQTEVERLNRIQRAYLSKRSIKDPRFARGAKARAIENYVLIDDRKEFVPKGFEDQHIQVDWSGWTIEQMAALSAWDESSPLVKARSILLFGLHHVRVTRSLSGNPSHVSLAQSLNQARRQAADCGVLLNPVFNAIKASTRNEPGRVPPQIVI